jgi:hypothetical protein
MPQTIFGESLALIKLFGSLRNLSQNIDEEELETMGLTCKELEGWLRDPYLHFKAWATSIAALHRPHLKSSLDFRLQDALQIKEQVLNLLRTLHDSLTEGQSHNSKSQLVLMRLSAIYSASRARQRVVDCGRSSKSSI